jgi:cytochrome c
MVVVVAMLGLPASARAESATAEEVVQKVREAALELAAGGESALETFRSKSSPYVWKDSYVFVSDCERGMLLAHPYQPERQGRPIADGPTYGGVTAADREAAQCAAAREPGGGWWEYPFPRPGETAPSRKVSFVMMVEGTPLIVGAGIYDDSVTIEQLRMVSAARQ